MSRPPLAAAAPVIAAHPGALLRERLVAGLSSDLPTGVHPLPGYCGEPCFFPGATGLLRATKWDQVDPGVEPVLTADYPDSRVRVMVVGNYRAGLASYQRVLA